MTVIESLDLVHRRRTFYLCSISLLPAYHLSLSLSYTLSHTLSYSHSLTHTPSF